jgi:hypothetical protein
MRIDGPQITSSLTLNGTTITDLNMFATTASLNTLSGSYATTGSNLFKGTQTISGSLIPAVDNTYDLGSITNQFRDLYLSSASLYIDGTKVLSSTTQELQITTDAGQSFKILEAGSDTITLQSNDGNITLATSGGGDVIMDPTNGVIALKGTTTVYAGNKIVASDGNNIHFGDGIVISGSILSTGTALVSGSSQVLNGSGVFSGSAQLPSGILSSSTQLSGFGFATTGSNNFVGTQTITGSLFISQNLVVQGSSSLENITASAVNIGANIVNLNTATPAIRFAGLNIFDSGSIGSSGSFLYDSVQDEFIFVHRGDNINVTSSVVMMGPQTYNNIGSEIYPTNNRILKGVGNEHIGDSIMSETGGGIGISGSLSITGSIIATGTSLVSGSSQIDVMSTTNIARLATTGSNTFSATITATGNASTTPSFIANNPIGSTGTAQHYADFTAGATVLGRLLRGNGASGLEANGLNIDNFAGFKVRLNQLGGSGGSFTIDGGNVGIGGSPSGTYGTLSVFGGVSIKDNNNAKLEIGRYSSGVSNSYIKLGANSNSLRFTNAGDLADIMELTNSGNLGLGVTPSSWASDWTVFQIGSMSSLGQYNTNNSVLLSNNYYNATTSGAGPRYIANGSAGAYQISSGVHYWYNAASGTANSAMTLTNTMILNNSGHLGLAVTPSSWGGSSKAIQIGARMSVYNDGFNNALFGNNTYYDGSNNIYINTAAASRFYLENTSAFLWQQAVSGTAGNTINFTTAMTLNASGNLGLGTTDTQTFRLAVDGPNVSQGDSTTTIRVFDTTSATTGTGGGISFAGYFSGTSSIINTLSYIKGGKENSTGGDYASYLSFGTRINGGSPSEKLRITSGGNVGVGTSAPSVRLQVVGANSTEGQLYVGNTDVTYSAGINFTTSGVNRGFVGWRHTNSGSPYSLTGIHLFNTDNSNIVFGTNGAVRAVIDLNGNLGINVNSPTQRLHVAGYIRTNGISVFKTGGSVAGFIGHEQDWFGTGASNNLICASEGGNEFKVFTNGGTAERITATTGGYVYLGKGWGASNHRINLEVAQGNNILVVSAYAGASNDSVLIRAASGANPNDAGTVMAVTTNSSTGRSISAGGTINASGNDYAEYMLKATTDTINKGDIVGVNIDGKLTNIFNEAISFVVKSTDPSYVGGDAWGTVVGKRPERTTDQTEEDFAPILAEFEARLEIERQKVDRIAFSGQVPVNVTGATVGDYIIPIETEDGKITGQAITNPSFEQYKISVGKVWKIMEDGRAFIAVKIG